MSLKLFNQITGAELQTVHNCYNYLLKQSLHREVGSEINRFNWGKTNEF